MRFFSKILGSSSIATGSNTHALLLALLCGTFGCPNVSVSGVSWEGGVTAVYQNSDDSRAESELTASADIFATLEAARGDWLLYIEGSTTPKSNGVSAFYPTVNGDARSVLTENGAGGVQISEFNYTFRSENESTMMLGLIDPSAWLDRGRIANDENKQFLNGSFVNNATIEFPDYTLGAVYRAPSRGRRPEITMVVSGSDGITDLPDRSYQDLLDFNADGRGVFFGAGANWLAGASSWRFGAWVRTDDHAVAGGETEQEKNYGVYAVYGWESGDNALNLRAGLANPDVSVVRDFFAVAYQRKFRFGQFGIGLAHTIISSSFRAGERGHAFDSEVYFRIPVFDEAGHLTPSIQYVEVPSFDVDGTVPGSTSVVSGVRFHYSF
jgi:hypothetical protein